MLPLDPSDLPTHLKDLFANRDYIAVVDWACNVSHLFPCKRAPSGFRPAYVLGLTVCGVQLIALHVSDPVSGNCIVYSTFHPEVLTDLDSEDGLAFVLCADHLDMPIKTLAELMTGAMTVCRDHELQVTSAATTTRSHQTEPQAMA